MIDLPDVDPSAVAEAALPDVPAPAEDAAATAASRTTPRPGLTPGRAILRRVPDRLPPPGPSFLREQAVEVGDRTLQAGMSRPTTPDGWWLAILWVVDAAASSRSATSPRSRAAARPAAGPPRTIAGGLAVRLILEDAAASRCASRLVPADDPTRPWRVPLAVRAAFRFEPARAAHARERARRDGPDRLPPVDRRTARP